MLIDAVAEVLTGFQQKSQSPIYVQTRTLFPPCTPCFRVSRVQQKEPNKAPLVPVNAMHSFHSCSTCHRFGCVTLGLCQVLMVVSSSNGSSLLAHGSQLIRRCQHWSYCSRVAVM